jgi:hypothetical protein
MTAFLHPCSSCARHVLTSEESCPFCGAELSPAGIVRRGAPKGRLGRAALVAFGTLAAVPQVACDDDDTPNVFAIYGAPPGGDLNLGGDANLGGETASGGETSSGGATGGAPEEGTGGDQLAPEYGLAPRP